MFDNLFSGMTGILDGYTAGDLVGMYSSFKKGTAGQKNTENHRAGQTPNINPFEDYGKEGLKTLDSAMDFGDDVLQNNLLNIENSRSQATDQSRATSRGINTMRATDLSNSLASSTAKNQAYSGFADSMMKMLTQKSAMENDQDLKVMSGEQMRDENDRNDYDAYYANKGQDTQAMFEAITQMGKNMNQKKARDVQTELINSMSKYFDIDIKTGKLKSKKD